MATNVEVFGGPVIALFDGQGVHNEGMGKDVYKRFGVARETFSAASLAVGVNMARVCFGDLVFLQKDTRIAQPAIATVNLAEARAWCELNDTEPEYVTGLSKGLYSAVSLAGMIKATSNDESDGKAVGLVARRAQIMHDVAKDHQGSMVAVVGQLRSGLAKLLPEGVKVGVSRGDKHYILTGPDEKMKILVPDLSKLFGRRVRPLPIDMAAHHPLQEETIPPLREELIALLTEDPNKKFIGNSPEPGILETVDEVIQHLLEQMTHEAQWDWTTEQIALEGIKFAVQFGPDPKRGLLRDVATNDKVKALKFPDYRLAA